MNTRSVKTAVLAALASLFANACVAGDASVDHGQQLEEIVGGTPVDDADYPWVVQIWNDIPAYFDQLTCTGTLIAPEWVLCAAHCTDGADFVKILGKRIEIVEKIDHPEADFPLNDVAVYRLAEPVDLPTTALNLDPAFPRPVPLAEASEEVANVTALGWGLTSYGGDVSDGLLLVDLAAVTTDTCQDVYFNDPLSPADLCAGVTAAGKSTCQGDSGGPLVSESFGSVQVGITSGGIGCGRENTPHVFARVSWFADWITSHVPDARTRSPTAILMAAL